MLKTALFLVMAGLFMAGPNSPGAGKAQCLANCKDSCTKTLNSCKSSAKTRQAQDSCQKSFQICNSNCVNKACK
jgi:hypothetical protein